MQCILLAFIMDFRWSRHLRRAFSLQPVRTTPLDGSTIEELRCQAQASSLLPALARSDNIEFCSTVRFLA